jgi:ubiquinone/menaquinone biosynthesis C-methylase UbiE
MAMLGALEGYRRWAPTYARETAISAIENRMVSAATPPPLAGLRLLDAGCGTGRRLREAGAASAVGVDLSPDMIAAGLGDTATTRLLVGDVRALPVADAAFDVVWCRLVIGHVADAAAVYHELARVAASGALVIVTDFHADAHAAGHRRSFRDAAGAFHEVEHHVHAADRQVALAEAAGLAPIAAATGRIDETARPFYEASGRGALFADHAGLAVVQLLGFRR